MDIKPIRTKRDYEQALRRIDVLLNAKAGTREADELDVISTLVEAYEERHHPIPPPDPIAAIEFMIEQRGLTRTDLEPYIGGSGRVSEVLSGKRPLSIDMVRALHAHLHIPAEVLIARPKRHVKPARRTQRSRPGGR